MIDRIINWLSQLYAGFGRKVHIYLQGFNPVSKGLKLHIYMKVTSIVQFLLVLIACSGHAVTCSLSSGNAADRLSLLDFKK